MSIKVQREDGTVSPYRHCEYIPAYFLIPQELLQTSSAVIKNLPRTPVSYFYDKNVIEIVESDLFFERITSIYAYMVWIYLERGKSMDSYSHNDIAWRLAHWPSLWITPLVQAKLIMHIDEFLKLADKPVRLGYITLDHFETLIGWSVEQVMLQYNLREIIEVTKQIPCFEDFSVFDSHAKTDFIRRWYHTRTKHPQISLEEFQENYAKNNNGKEWDTVDESIDLEKELTEKAIVESFLETLSEKDKAILKMRMDGYTLEEIADELGYANHSGVLKRIRKIGQAYEQYADVDFGFSEKKIV